MDIIQEDGLLKEQTLGITDLGNYFLDMKRKQGELHWIVTASLLYYCLQKDNLGQALSCI